MIEVLLITKGHPFEKEAFFQIFDAMDGVNYTHVEQPAAQVFFDPDLARPYDLFVCYDMPGIVFHDEPGRAPDFPAPSADLKNGFAKLLNCGHPFLFLHHALAGWPTWPEYAEAMGGRFLYTPGELRGKPCLDSGYRHDVTYTVECTTRHPVLEGIPETFEITDELYLAEIFTDSIVPLLAARHEFTAQNFYSAAHAVIDGRLFSNQDWHHPPGPNLIGWVKTAGNSPVVYLQPGDGPGAYGNPHYRRLLSNAILWLASDDARAWAAAQAG
ncbi:MAG: ThuA domain-containing protein [Alphaproteobacteria bacterium]|nr:MAG: ThuA domain-containing protein [Alphaproteobacteria bacterium]